MQTRPLYPQRPEPRPLYPIYQGISQAVCVGLIFLGVFLLYGHNKQAHAESLHFGELPQKTIHLPTGKTRESSPESKQIHTENASVPAAEIIPILKKAGFKGEKLRLAYAVMRAESGGRPTALNVNSTTGDRSYGIFQVNMIGRLGPARLRQYHLASYDDLFDPLTNATIAYKMSNGGTNWKPWGAYRSNSYRPHLAEIPSSLL
jgi:hypothetical protein